MSATHDTIEPRPKIDVADRGMILSKVWDDAGDGKVHGPGLLARTDRLLDEVTAKNDPARIPAKHALKCFIAHAGFRQKKIEDDRARAGFEQALTQKRVNFAREREAGGDQAERAIFRALWWDVRKESLQVQVGERDRGAVDAEEDQPVIGRVNAAGLGDGIAEAEFPIGQGPTGASGLFETVEAGDKEEDAKGDQRMNQTAGA